MTVPPQGDFTQERACSRLLGYNDDGSERVCKKLPVVHIAWSDDPDGITQGWACPEHMDEALTRWKPFQHHDLGACCGLPGTLWSIEQNVCFYPDGEIPAEEPVRAIAQPLEVASA